MAMHYRYLLVVLTTAGALLVASGGTASAQGNGATATFSRTDVRVAEGNTAPVEVRIAPPEEDDPFPALTGGRQVILDVTPAAAVTTADCPTGGDADEDERAVLRIWSDSDVLLQDDDTGAITIEKDLRDYEGAPAELRLTACDDTTDYRDSSVTLAFQAASLETTRGNVTAGPSAIVSVLNDDPVPVVEFATGALTLDEGGSQTVAIVTDGELASAVMQVAVGVTGDARVSVLQDDRMLDQNPDGTFAVALSSSGTARLTIHAEADDGLAPGETKMATLEIVDASGADIGAIDTLTLTVNGAAAVPALPLLGQMLLTLLLMTGGARLYRRRRN